MKKMNHNKNRMWVEERMRERESLEPTYKNIVTNHNSLTDSIPTYKHILAKLCLYSITNGLNFINFILYIYRHTYVDT